MFSTPRYVIKGGECDRRGRRAARRRRPGTSCASASISIEEIERTLRAAVRGAVQRAVRQLPRARAVAAGARPQGPRRARRERAMRLADAEVVDTFAEAFPMWAARIVITAESSGWADTGRPLADRLRHLGDRLQVRGRHRARARSRPRRPTAGRASARCCSPPIATGWPSGWSSASARACSPALRRPASTGWKARRRSTSAASCASSATAIRPARCSTGAATGGCR